MILFIILAAIALLLIIFAVCIISLGGAVGIFLCSDVIVCIGILVFIMTRIFKKKKRK